MRDYNRASISLGFFFTEATRSQILVIKLPLLILRTIGLTLKSICRLILQTYPNMLQLHTTQRCLAAFVKHTLR